jgi:hypothetical protein
MNEPVKRLRLDTLGLAIFTDALQTNLVSIPALREPPLLVDLDNEARQLTQALQAAYSKAAKRTTGRNTGQPWWNTDCKTAANENRKVYSPETARNLRNTVRKAKSKY